VNKIDVVEVKVGKTFEERVLTVLGSQVKQEIADRLRDNLRALGKTKEERAQSRSIKTKEVYKLHTIEAIWSNVQT